MPVTSEPTIDDQLDELFRDGWRVTLSQVGDNCYAEGRIGRQSGPTLARGSSPREALERLFIKAFPASICGGCGCFVSQCGCD